jgi:hypothetical protein
MTWKQKFNKKYGCSLDANHSLAEVARLSGYTKSGLQEIYDKGVGAWKSNPSSVRLKGNFKKDSDLKAHGRNQRLSKEQWAMARVYGAVMKNPRQKMDFFHLKKRAK